MIELKNLLLYAEEEVDPAVLERAVRVARTHGAKLTLAAVVEPAGSRSLLSRRNYNSDEVEQLLVEDRRRRLEESIRKIGDVDISIRVLVGDPVVSIIQAVMAEQIDFLFKSPAPSHGLRRHLFGSTDTCLMRACPCPVAIGRPRTGEGAGRAVAAIDYDKGDETKAHVNQAILDACLLALRGDHPELHIVHAWSLYGETLLGSARTGLPPERFAEVSEEERNYRQQWLDELVQKYRATLDEAHAARFNPKIELLHGDPTIAGCQVRLATLTSTQAST